MDSPRANTSETTTLLGDADSSTLATAPRIRLALRLTWFDVKSTLHCSYANWLLPTVPIGILAGILGWGSTAIFTINCFAMIPLVTILSFVTKQISIIFGKTMGVFLDAFFSNAFESAVSITALANGQIDMAKTLMLGVILSNCVSMGMCFLCGGIVHRGRSSQGTEQDLSPAMAQATSSLMTLFSASLLILEALYWVEEQSSTDCDENDMSILILSRGTAVILLALYAIYLIFQKKTHSNLFDAEDRADAEREVKTEEPKVGLAVAALVMIITVALVTTCVHYIAGSMDDMEARFNINKAFIGIFLIPNAGNVTKHTTAVVEAIHNRMDIAMSVAMGSSIPTAFLTLPLLLILDWITGGTMSLRFGTFEELALGIFILSITYTIRNGKSNYLEGAVLVGLYIIFAVAFLTAPFGVSHKHSEP